MARGAGRRGGERGHGSDGASDRARVSPLLGSPSPSHTTRQLGRRPDHIGLLRNPHVLSSGGHPPPPAPARPRSPGRAAEPSRRRACAAALTDKLPTDVVPDMNCFRSPRRGDQLNQPLLPLLNMSALPSLAPACTTSSVDTPRRSVCTSQWWNRNLTGASPRTSYPSCMPGGTLCRPAGAAGGQRRPSASPRCTRTVKLVRQRAQRPGRRVGELDQCGGHGCRRDQRGRGGRRRATQRRDTEVMRRDLPVVHHALQQLDGLVPLRQPRLKDGDALAQLRVLGGQGLAHRRSRRGGFGARVDSTQEQ